MAKSLVHTVCRPAGDPWAYAVATALVEDASGEDGAGARQYARLLRRKFGQVRCVWACGGVRLAYCVVDGCVSQ